MPEQGKIGNGRELDGSIFKGSVVETDCTGCNYDIAGLYVKIDSAAGSGADESIGTAHMKFFNSDGSGRTADSGGTDGNFFAKKIAGVKVIFAVIGNLFCIVKICGDGFNSSGVTGDNAIAADVTLFAT